MPCRMMLGIKTDQRSWLTFKPTYLSAVSRGADKAGLYPALRTAAAVSPIWICFWRKNWSFWKVWMNLVPRGAVGSPWHSHLGSSRRGLSSHRGLKCELSWGCLNWVPCSLDWMSFHKRRHFLLSLRTELQALFLGEGYMPLVPLRPARLVPFPILLH